MPADPKPRRQSAWDADRDANAVAHVAWLAKTRRHTHCRDNWTAWAVSKGWARLTAGTVAGYSRVALTDAGRVMASDPRIEAMTHAF